MIFDFFMPTKLITGSHCIQTNGALLSSLGNHCLIVTSGSAAKKSGALQEVIDTLTLEKIAYTIHDTVEQNPMLADAHSAGQTAKTIGANFVLGIGGGSAQDAAKVIAVFAANDMEPDEIYALNWKNKALPIVVVGTTAGTGSEVTMFAVMTQDNGVKRSVSHVDCYPTIAFGDPRYTATLPVSFTVSTALDALSHAIEGYFSTVANAFTDLFAKEASRILYETLSQIDKAATNPDDITEEQRNKLYYASISAGMTLAHTGTTYCHSLGYFLSEEYAIPHGVACSVFLRGFITRQATLLPQKAKALFAAIGCSQEELIELIDRWLPAISVNLTSEEITQLVARYDSSSNFKKTAPDGLSTKEAEEIMRSLFFAE